MTISVEMGMDGDLELDHESDKSDAIHVPLFKSQTDELWMENAGVRDVTCRSGLLLLLE